MDGGSDWRRKHLDDSPAELQASRLTVSMSLRIPHLQEKKKKKKLALMIHLVLCFNICLERGKLKRLCECSRALLSVRS